MADWDASAPGYPHAWEADLVLSDGSVARVRPITPDDTEGLHRFHAGQSAESVYLRFFAPVPQLSARDVHRFTHVDHHDRVALVVVIGGEIAGIGRFDRLGEDEGSAAEVAFNVADAHRGKGIGSVLLEHLADIGSELGVRRFLADVLPQNRRMLAVFREAGFAVRHEYDDGVLVVSFDIEPTDRSREVRLAREHRAEGRSMRRVLHPSGVAVVGVPADGGSVGGQVLRHIKDGGFTGRLFAVGAHAAQNAAVVAGLPVVGSLEQIQEPVDVVVIAVPAPQVLPVVRQCEVVGAKAVLVISSGFADDGTPEGARAQSELLAACRAGGMRLLGPNSLGLINADPAVCLNASLVPTRPEMGGLGLFAQSGALGVALLGSAQGRGLGVSSFVSAGNRADISGNDLMQYWLDDDATAAVGLYLESMGNPRKFTRIARELAAVKPVVAVRSGVGPGGATPGHRVRRTSQRPEVFDEMLRQSGVIRVQNTHQLFDVAELVLHQPMPAGPRVAVVTTSPALGALASEACQSWGLETVGEPVTLSGADGAEAVSAAVAEAMADERVDAVVLCVVPVAPATEPAIDERIAPAAAGQSARHGKPCVATLLGHRGTVSGLPTYAMPEDAVRALASVVRYAQWRRHDRGRLFDADGVNRRTAHDVIESFLRQEPGGGVLSQRQSQDLLDAYGIGLWPVHPVSSPKSARKAAARIDGPVVLKATAPELRHEPSLRWVRIGLSTPAACAAAYTELADSLAERASQAGTSVVSPIAVQAAAPSGVAVQVSTTEDPLFGPVVGFGVAGVPTDLLHDVTHRFPPLRSGDVADMVSGIRAAALLRGYRGAEPVHLAALHDLLGRVSLLADDHLEIASLSLNPVIAHAEGVAVLGAHIRVTRSAGRSDLSRRTLNRDGEGGVQPP
ncbi:MAG TPA: GNAT family N-acetyltransferase [Ornithinimicrobium sp.]|uniref:bifunctional acetate--CoA ligase family protein/GNAT family N-acetyltransferase n=1 Tax=Ornithinimicrobium sp. TaxID=1977084 RepID=UPI002B49AA4D|nr:GNAT family N-acetyltransferase [Ornithinimicrobium sp.]HKJ13038.1 GNAT family N-acetyltransferase [Ornithinimicrobium sp.]